MSAQVMVRRGDQVSRWVCFELGTQVFGLPILQVQEVLAQVRIEPVPGAAPMVLGVINLRGNVVTVIDLRLRLGHPVQVCAQPFVVIVDYKGEPVGLRVDRIADVRKIAEGAIKPPPLAGAGAQAAQVRGIVSRGAEMLTLLDADELLGHSQLVF